MLRLARSSTTALCRRVAVQSSRRSAAPLLCSASTPSLSARFAVASVSPFNSKADTLFLTSCRTYTSSSSSPSPDLQQLVFTTVAELMAIKEPADQARITLKSHMLNDLGMDVFKKYQLLDKLERELESIDIAVQDADKAQTLEDIVTIVRQAQAQSQV